MLTIVVLVWLAIGALLAPFVGAMLGRHRAIGPVQPLTGHIPQQRVSGSTPRSIAP
jgi:hypothetical protein